jgi:PAS domain S-box-containing protein
MLAARRVFLMPAGEAGTVVSSPEGPMPPWLPALARWAAGPEVHGVPVHTLLEPKAFPGLADQPLPEGTRLMLLDPDEGTRGLLLVLPGDVPRDVPGGARWAALALELLACWEAAERERRLLEAAVGLGGQGFLVVDPEGRVRRYGGRAQEILGVPASEALGRPAEEVFRPVDLKTSPLRMGLEGTLEEVELYIRHASGREVPVALRMTPVRDAAGEVWFLVALFRDISEERAYEENARLKERLASIGELATGVAHEIRNPLTGIQNCAQLLRERLEDRPEVHRFVEIILREGERLNRIVDSLLRFTRPGRPRMRRARLEETLRQVLELEAPKLEGAGIRWRMEVQPEVPALFFDPDQMTQVFHNLVRNAREAMAEGGELEVTVEVVERHPYRRRGLGRRATDRVGVPGKPPLVPFVRVRIRDTGPGIPEEIQSRIFDPFFTTRSEGTGLGLSLSQTIVQEHGGFLSIHSVPGHGTTAEVDLPVERRRGERRRSQDTASL